MECPKCHNEVGEHEKICPYCRKVLLLECPICHKFNRTALCSECGFVIISKCHNCGQLNPTIKGVCKKCGFDTYKSISMNEAETDEFACLAITFPNLEALRPALKNKQIFNKFYKKLKSMIFSYGKSQDNRVQLINDAFIIKYYKEFSMTSSVKKAVKSAIELMNKIAEISYKLKKSKGTKMACKMAILKRTLDNDNKSFNTGLNIKLIDTDVKKDNYANGLQIITDQHINNIISREYKLEMIYSSQVDDELLEFYEFPVASQLTPIVEDTVEEDRGILNKPKELPKLSELEEEEPEIDLYSNKAINIQTVCEFLSMPGAKISNKLIELLEKPVFVTIKASSKLTLFSSDIRESILQTTNKLLHVVCTNGFVYEPFSFFRELIASYLGYDSKVATLEYEQAEKLKNIDEDGILYKLLAHKNLEEVLPEEALKRYMELFYKFINAQKGSTILVENFNLIDETSLEILISMVENFKEMGISFVVTVPEDYLVHKEINELLYIDAYKEITVTKSNYEDLISTIKDDMTEINDSFYIQKIKDQFLGRSLYFKHAMNYLKDANIITAIEGKLKISSDKTLIFPAALEALITKRFELLPENEGLILAYSTILGDKIHLEILKDLDIQKPEEAIKSLLDRKWIDYRDSMVVIQNYNLVKDCIKDALSDEVKEILTKNILEKLHTRNLEILKSLGLVTKSQMIIYKLSLYSINHGDFNAYLRNCKRFLSLISNIAKRNMLPEIIDAKNDIYSTLSNYINKYPSHKIYAISKIIYDDATRKKDDLKIMNLSSLMLDSALMGENYILAQQSLQQVLVRMSNPKYTEGQENLLAKYFFYSCINVKIMFHSGKFKQCIEAINKILSSISQELLEQLQNSNVSQEAFVTYTMSILVYGALSKILICDKDMDKFFEKIKYIFNSDIPSIEYILQLQDLLHKKDFDFDYTEEIETTSKEISTFINAFKTFDGNYDLFAQNIYKTKLAARSAKESFFSLISDLLIGYSYQKVGSNIKAGVIFNDVASISQKSGMTFINLLSNWFIGNLKYETHKFDAAYKIASDNIMSIKRSATNDRFVNILFHILLVNVVIAQNNLDVDIKPLLYQIDYGCKKYDLEYLKEGLVDCEEFISKYQAKIDAKNAELEDIQNAQNTNDNTPENNSEDIEPTTNETIENQGE